MFRALDNRPAACPALQMLRSLCPLPNYSPFYRWLDRQTGRFINATENLSDVEEHRLPIALKIDVECVDDRTVSLRPGRDQRSAPLWLLDDIQHRILGICRFLVAKIHTRG